MYFLVGEKKKIADQPTQVLETKCVTHNKQLFSNGYLNTCLRVLLKGLYICRGVKQVLAANHFIFICFFFFILINSKLNHQKKNVLHEFIHE